MGQGLSLQDAQREQVCRLRNPPNGGRREEDLPWQHRAFFLVSSVHWDLAGALPVSLSRPNASLAVNQSMFLTYLRGFLPC